MVYKVCGKDSTVGVGMCVGGVDGMGLVDKGVVMNGVGTDVGGVGK